MRGNCADCGGFDVEWMHQCHKHKGVQFCRGCSCPYCLEDDADCRYDDYDFDDEYTTLGEPDVR